MKKNKKRKRKFFFFVMKALLFLGVIIGGILFALNSNYFNIKSVTVSGNDKIDPDKIEQASGIHEGQNIFKIDTSFAVKSIMENQYIDSVDVERQMPSKIVIHIKERHKFAIINGNNFITIDSKGDALEANEDNPDLDKKNAEKYVIIKGLKFNFARIGEKLNFDNKNLFNSSILIINLLKKYRFSDKIKELDASDEDEITLYDNYSRKIILYNTDGIENKIRALNAILKKLSPFDKGTIDFGYKNPVFIAN